ncbi:MAG TPA: sulfotransferase [Frankiaceae bacterium]|jgi:hypothetical protein|nr:sulfotransferase [Frankiaceae bacterium]
MPLLAGGRRVSPPDFIGVGVQRGGSSWWHRLLEAHPDVSPLGLGAKELHFFDEFWRGDFQASDERAYHQLFLRPEGMLGGEWTPRYMFDPWTPPLLRRAAPDARLLVLLRDPVARFRSGVTHAATHGGRVTSDVINTAIARGMYAAQVRRLLEHFPREQVLVLQFERCREDPAAMLRFTFEFLGIDPARYPSSIRLSEPRNASVRAPEAVDEKLLAGLPKIYFSDVCELLELTGASIDPGLWPSFIG